VTTTDALTSNTEAYRAARDVLLRHRDDLPAARAQFRWPVTDGFNWVLDWFDTIAPGNDAAALTVVGPRGERASTYEQLAERSKRAARWLAEEGVAPGDAVLLVSGTRTEFWEVVLAAMRLGIVLVPTFPTATPADLRDRVERAHVRHVIADPAVTDKIDNLPVSGARISFGPRPGWSDYGQAAAAAPIDPVRRAGGDAPLFVYFTSGTTAAPKLIEHSHTSWSVGHLSSFYWNGLRPGDLHCNLAAPGWAKHAWSSFFVPFTAQAAVLAFEESIGDPHLIVERLRGSDVDSICAPPTMWRRLIQAGLGRPPARLSDATSVGERLPRDVIDTVRAAWSVEIRDGFGQTEVTGMIGTPPGARTEDGAIGYPLPGYDIVLIDPSTGQAGPTGEICVDTAGASPAVRPWMVRDDGRYHTGDLAETLPDGRIRCLGRIDDVFKSFDKRISPQELESIICTHPLVHDAAVIPIPHPVGNWEPKAYVEIDVKAEAADDIAEFNLAEEIFALIANRLPAEKAVSVIEFVDIGALPRTPSGKIQRKRLWGLPPDGGYRAGNATSDVSR
jgi:acetyl-CoA synthetase